MFKSLSAAATHPCPISAVLSQKHTEPILILYMVLLYILRQIVQQMCSKPKFCILYSIPSLSEQAQSLSQVRYKILKPGICLTWNVRTKRRLVDLLQLY